MVIIMDFHFSVLAGQRFGRQDETYLFIEGVRGQFSIICEFGLFL